MRLSEIAVFLLIFQISFTLDVSGSFSSSSSLELMLSEPINSSATVWLDNSTRTKDILFLNGSSTLSVVPSGWNYLNINVSNQTLVLSRNNIVPSSTPDYLFYSIALALVFLAAFLLFRLFSKKSTIRIFLPETKQEHLKFRISSAEIFSAIHKLDSLRGHPGLFSVTELKHSLENSLRKKGINESISEFSLYIALQKLVQKEKLCEHNGLYIDYDHSDLAEEFMVFRKVKEKLMAKGDSFRVELVKGLPVIITVNQTIACFVAQLPNEILSHGFVFVCRSPEHQYELQHSHYLDITSKRFHNLTVDSF